MMNDFWKTVLSSAGFSVVACAFLGWLFREWISARLTKSIQHEYDVKLEDFKSRIHFEYELKLEANKKDFQRVLDEHQIRFKYWYDEKSKAIKDLFYSITDLNYSLHEAEYLFLELKTGNAVDDIKKYIENKPLNFPEKYVDCFNNWQKLSLFLKDEEYDQIKSYFDVCSDLNKRYEQYTKDNNLVSYIGDIFANLGKMNEAIANLRKIFRGSLKNDTLESLLEYDDEQKDPIDQNEPTEQKPSTE